MAGEQTRTIRIVVNGEARSVPEGQTVLGLLKSLEIEPSRVAIEFNRDILPKSRWPETGLEEGARLEIVHFVGGG